jgi:hypothetical protein
LTIREGLARLLYPYDDDARGLIDGWLDELEQGEHIRRYEVDGSQYLEVVKWLEHQKIDKPSKSRFPAFDESSRIVAKPREASATDLGPRTKDQDLGPRTKETRVSALAEGWPPDFREQFWAKYPNRVGKPKALAKLEQCMRRGIQWSAIIDGLDSYIRTKPPDRAWLNPETFINQERWADQPAAVSINGRRTVHDAARDLHENLVSRVLAFDEPAPGGICERESEDVVRLLPARRCE